MALSLAPCRCCRGVLHRLSDLSRARPFSSSSSTLQEGFRLPSRDWSAHRFSSPLGSDTNGGKAGLGAKRGGSRDRGDNKGDIRGDKRGDNRGQNRGENGGNRRRQQLFGAEGRDSIAGPSKEFGAPNNRRRDTFSQGLGKWGVSSESSKDKAPIASGFGLKSARGESARRGTAFGDILDKTRTGRRKDEKPRGPSAFGDLLNGSFDGEKRNRTTGGRDDSSQKGLTEDTGVAGGAPVTVEDNFGGDGDSFAERSRHGASRDRRGRSREASGSLLSRLQAAEEDDASLPSRPHHKRDHRSNNSSDPTMSAQTRKPKTHKPKLVEVRAEKEVYIPRTISTGNLAKIFGVKLFPLQAKMMRLDMSDDQRRSDYLMSAEEACNIAIEYGYNPVVDDEASFDIYPDPDPADGADQHLRPPVVTIMGHVDHGKTTLLDSLRHTSVAASEAGGITQHIGAFSVPLSSLLPNSPSSQSTITFLDTPGHAAFTAMRARGASVTDIVVLVVAADDGVMPQTREVLELVKSEGDKVGLVVAINKCDKPGVDVDKVKSALGAEGIHLEEDGGDVPSVRVSGLTKLGLDDLVETLSTLAELRDLRARKEGKAEGYVLESRVDKGRGNIATVLVTKGTLRTSASIVAGQTWCRVRQMQDDKGKAIREALPGTPVSITGWKELPSAGDELLEAVSGEDEAKKAVNNRKRDEERKRMLADVEQINAKRREERMRVEAEAAALEAAADGGVTERETLEGGEVKPKEAKEEYKPLRLVIKADVSGTVEAVVGALEHIGNKDAGVKIVHTGVGEVVESDITQAEASEATIIGFNVSASRQIQTLAKSAHVPLQLESVIYRLIDQVRTRVAALLPPKIEYSVKGEASVLQLFSINIKRKQAITIAGCRVGNGVINRTEGVRVLRGEGREVVYEGKIETLKHLKKEVQEVRKGMECGIALEGFADIREGDEIVTFTKIEVPREL
ncbi:translation initiation factor IF-2 [Kwoniella newhampshirensis]|uniref:Eukaryotic translation initiation factor 5B n=1 Tax=Kwoniella newhampshirensis TaxID=1651941 RepID=A0AAW0Z1J8_9TREE